MADRLTDEQLDQLNSVFNMPCHPLLNSRAWTLDKRMKNAIQSAIAELTALRAAPIMTDARHIASRVLAENERLEAKLKDAHRMIALLVCEAGGSVFISDAKLIAIDDATVFTRRRDETRCGDVISISGHEDTEGDRLVRDLLERARRGDPGVQVMPPQSFPPLPEEPT